ncbi:hypothetical protein F6X40_42320 [Paraburkholderia sp. UCT31]|uniref:topoisomerase DNA-binding C4 zinc finger domain-containing protein n=1 Tax=Paraburkholderia sp. UCT31 TaxID=2615209 RepID=UPI0016551357|nr:hypothetical protein [Paraburkholderia sp. UCT31]
MAETQCRRGFRLFERPKYDPLESCPGCGNGVVQLKSGKHRAFYGCRRFPACDYKRKATEREGAAHRQGMDQSCRIRGPVKAGNSCSICGHVTGQFDQKLRGFTERRVEPHLLASAGHST